MQQPLEIENHSRCDREDDSLAGNVKWVLVQTGVVAVFGGQLPILDHSYRVMAAELGIRALFGFRYYSERC